MIQRHSKVITTSRLQQEDCTLHTIQFYQLQMLPLHNKAMLIILFHYAFARAGEHYAILSCFLRYFLDTLPHISHTLLFGHFLIYLCLQVPLRPILTPHWIRYAHSDTPRIHDPPHSLSFRLGL